MNLSPSKIVLESLKHHANIELPLAEGVPVTEDTHCGACGVTIPKGSNLVWIRPSGVTFTDWQYLVSPALIDGQLPVCTHCATLFTKDFQVHQTRAAAAVYSAKGAWMLTLDAERLAFLLDPPAPPFVAYIATTMGQHVVWRAPITMDKDLIRLGVARDSITINRPRLLEASALCFELAEAIRTEMKDAKGKPIDLKPNHPFVFLDRKMEDPAHGLIRADIRKWMLEHGKEHQVDFLERLGEGELWGLAVLNKAKKEESVVTTIKDKFAAKREQSN